MKGMSDTSDIRICDKCNNLYTTPDGTREGCSNFPSCDYVRLRLSGIVASCCEFAEIKPRRKEKR